MDNNDMDNNNIYNNRNDDSNINNITLEYLMNPQHYGKYVNTKSGEKTETRNKDKKFYRKRIIFLTKQMLKGEFPNDELKKNFEEYLDSLIEHFQIIDKQDIIQADYSNMNNTTKNITDIDETYILSNSNMSNNDLMFNNSSKKMVTMDNFVTKTNKKHTHPILPVKKNIDLKNPNLRNKGIKKKKKHQKEEKKEI
jgi:hypothetical protein